MARYFVADIHLLHQKVAKLRGFSDVLYHDMKILGQLAALTEEDQLWILGDISSGKPEEEDLALAYLKKHVKAEMHLISGNHDSCSSVHRDGWKHHARFLTVFKTVQDFARFRFFGTQVLLSHYPYAEFGDGPEREGARYLEYRLPDTGWPLIHGHTHQTTPHIPKYPTGEHTSMFCVSWDAHRNIVHESQINNWIEKWRKERGSI